MMQQNRARIAEGDLSTRVLETLAAEIGCSPIEFHTPLYEVIDPDALNALFEGGTRTGRVEFSYLGYRVVVDANGDVQVTRLE